MRTIINFIAEVLTTYIFRMVSRRFIPLAYPYDGSFESDGTECPTEDKFTPARARNI